MSTTYDNNAKVWPRKDDETFYSRMGPNTRGKIEAVATKVQDPEAYKNQVLASMHVAAATNQNWGDVLNDLDNQATRYYKKPMKHADIVKDANQFYEDNYNLSGPNGFILNVEKAVTAGLADTALMSTQGTLTQAAQAFGSLTAEELADTEKNRAKEIRARLKEITKGDIDFTTTATSPHNRVFKSMSPEDQEEYLALHQELEDTRTQVKGNIQKAVDQSVLTDYAKSVGKARKSVERFLDVDPEFKESFIGQVAHGIGQLGFYIPASMVPYYGTVAIESALFQEAVDDYYDSGGTNSQEAFKVGIRYALPALVLERAGLDVVVGKIWRGLPKGGKLSFKDIAKRAAKEAPKGGLIEGGTEPMQGMLLDYIASQNYDEGRDVLLTKEAFQRRVMEAAVGFTVGSAGAGGTTSFQDFVTERQRNKAFKTAAGNKVFTKEDFQEARLRLTDEYVRKTQPPQIAELFIDAMNEASPDAAMKYNMEAHLKMTTDSMDKVQSVGPTTLYKGKDGHHMVYRPPEGPPVGLYIPEGSESGQRLINGLMAKSQYIDRFGNWGPEKTRQFQQHLNAQESIPNVVEAKDGYVVITEDGKQVGTYKTKEEALDAGFEFTVKQADKDKAAIIGRLAASLQEMQGGRFDFVDETDVNRTLGTPEELAALEQESPGKLEELRNSYRLIRNMDPDAPVSIEDLANQVIGGASVQEEIDGVKKWVSHFYNGGDITVAIEEMSESYIKTALQQGLVSEDQLLTWYQTWLDNTPGLPQAYTLNLEGGIEHFGDMVKSRILTDDGAHDDATNSKLLREMLGETWFDTFVRKLRAWLQNIMIHARHYARLKQQGLISEDLDAHMDAALGTNEAILAEIDAQAEQDRHAAELEKELGVTFQSAFHGSPHKFDKFSLEHIGKGEGAQAYGWGLYFAGNKEVAAWYRKNLNKGRGFPLQILEDGKWKGVDGTLRTRSGEEEKFISLVAPYIDEYNTIPEIVQDLINSSESDHREFQKKIDKINEGIEELEPRVRYLTSNAMPIKDKGDPRLEQFRAKKNLGFFKNRLKAAEDRIAFLNSDISDRFRVKVREGALYKVELAPEEDEYLLWDQWVSDHPPSIKNALENLRKDKFSHISKEKWDRYFGSEIYRIMVHENQIKGQGHTLAQQQASEDLHEAGIRGNKYLDGSSRGRGDGNYNYVIFDDSDIEITDTFQLKKAQIEFQKEGVGDTDANWAAAQKYRPATGKPKNEGAVFSIDGNPISLGGTEGTDFATWISEQDAWYSPEESRGAAEWYNVLLDTMVGVYGKEKAPFMMSAWLMAQRNESPTGAFRNIYRVLDRMYGLIHDKKGGLADEELESLFRKSDLAGTIGPKISDFLDSGYGRSSRTYMGGRAEAGKPFVADVWTGRDFGFVDHATLNRLIKMSDEGRLTRDGQAVSYKVLEQKIVQANGKDKVEYVEVKFTSPGWSQTFTADITGSPQGAAYERAVQWGNALTDHLNENAYLGKTDWEPMQIQAMGWMRILRQYGRPEETLEMAMNRNTSRISAEVNFDLGPVLARDFPSTKELSPAAQKGLVKNTLSKAIPEVIELMHLQGEFTDIQYGPGVYGGEVNPSATFGWMGSEESAEALSVALAYVTEQESTARVIFGKGGQSNRALVIRKSDDSEWTGDDVNSLRDFAMDILNTKGHPLRSAARHYYGWTKNTWEAGFSINALPGAGNTMMSHGLSGNRAEGIHEIMDAWSTENGIDLSIEDSAATSSFIENNWKDNPDGSNFLQAFEQQGGSREIWNALTHYRGSRYPSILRSAYERTKGGRESLARRSESQPGQTFQLVQARHYSRRGDLTKLDPAYHGTGIPGAESARRRGYPEIYQDRIYIGLPGYEKEGALSDNEYPFIIETDRLYDIVDDPDGLWQEATEIRNAKYAPMDRNALMTIMENLVKENGHLGYRSGDVGVLLHGIPLDGTPIDENFMPETFQLKAGQKANEAIPDNAGIEEIDELFELHHQEVMRETAEMQRQAELKAIAENRVPLKNQRGFVSYLGLPVSSSIRRYAPEVFAKLREHDFQLNIDVAFAVERTLPFRKAMKKLSKQQQLEVGLALSNQYHGDAKAILNNDEAYDQLIEVINEIGKLAKRAGFEFDFMNDYFPRLVTDLDGLFESYGKEIQGPMQDAIYRAEIANKAPLSEEERIVIMNRFIEHGTPGSDAPSFTKNRKIPELTPEQYENFYAPVNDALDSYINRMLTAIANRKFFGKQTAWVDVETEVDYSGLKDMLEGDKDLSDFNIEGGKVTVVSQKKTKINLEQSVGNFVDLSKLNPAEQQQLRDDLQAYFGYQVTVGAWQKFRSLAYLTTMGTGIASTMTQLQDTAFAAVEGGWSRVPVNYLASVFGVSETKIERDLGLGDYSQEYKDMITMSKMVDNVFKATMLKHFGRAGQNTLVNVGLDAYRSSARKGRFSGRQRERLNEYFANDQRRIAALKKDLANHVMSADVHLLGWNILQDYHPASLTEMPRGYLENPRGRVFYILKTFTIKQFDSYRREGVAEMARGLAEKDLGRFTKGFLKLSQLMAYLWLAGFPVDWLKDFVFDRNPTMSDVMVDNVWKLGGLSRYVLYYGRQYGYRQAILLQFPPPMPFIDYPARDIDNYFRDKNIPAKDLQTWRITPGFGQFYYWWHGGGHEQMEKERERERKKQSKKSKSSGL